MGWGYALLPNGNAVVGECDVLKDGGKAEELGHASGLEEVVHARRPVPKCVRAHTPPPSTH